jgi:hypothetical protein
VGTNIVSGYLSWRFGNASGAPRIKKDPELSRLIEHRKPPCDGLITMTEDQILTAVLNDQLFGALEGSKLFSLIFKNEAISITLIRISLLKGI